MNQTKELQECREATEIKVETLKNYPLANEEKDTIFIVDTETGGLNPDIHALLDVHFRSLQSDFKFTIRLPIYKSVTHDALCVNKLNWIDIISRPREEPKNFNLFKEIIKRNLIIIGHNIDFDIKFIEKHLINNFICYTIDTRLLAKKMYPNIKDYSLKNLSKGIVGKYNEELAHTAEYDCILTENLLKKMLEEDKENKLNLKWLAMELKNLNVSCGD